MAASLRYFYLSTLTAAPKRSPTFSWKVERRQASPPWIMADEASAYVRFYQFLCSLASTRTESTTRLSIAVCCPGGLAYPGSPSVPAYTRAHAVTSI
ncbi:hypothetical protein GEV33_002254 [Tenebrio molitor]|uniref:Uncharacterized protein n=1 Tax=Tenebrio molitor TaxID=7067 RepID=A0A8J6LJ01_TENMO|nr:hypothetical protein GEV33_002254 [Tenebrio molitor]